MKSSTPELMKFKRLQRRLKESTRAVVGLLEMLWLGTAKNCPQGDIGRFTNLDIAIMCDYDGDPDELVLALVEERWLDEDSEHRLVVHDWHEHCPTHVANNLKRWGKAFANRQNVGQSDNKHSPKDHPKEPPKETPKDNPVGASFLAKPSLAKPSPTEPDQADVCVEPLPATTPPTKTVEDEPVDTSLEFYITGDPKRREWYPPLSLIDRLERAFDTIDVRSELVKAAAYTYSNRNRRKTASGMPKFLFSWMTRTANSSRGPMQRIDKQAQVADFLRSL